MARETARDPIDVDTDHASLGWTDWEQKSPVRVKREHSTFKSLRPSITAIDLSSPSPSPKKSKTAVASVPVTNPDNAVLGLPSDDDELPEQSLEKELEKMMDAEGFSFHEDTLS